MLSRKWEKMRGHALSDNKMREHGVSDNKETQSLPDYVRT